MWIHAKLNSRMWENPRHGLPAGCAPLHQIHCQCLWRHRPAQMSGGLPRPSDGRKTPDAKHKNLFLNSTLIPSRQCYWFNTQTNKQQQLTLMRLQQHNYGWLTAHLKDLINEAEPGDKDKAAWPPPPSWNLELFGILSSQSSSDVHPFHRELPPWSPHA